MEPSPPSGMRGGDCEAGVDGGGDTGERLAKIAFWEDLLPFKQHNKPELVKYYLNALTYKRSVSPP